MFSKIVVLYEIYSKKSLCPNTFDQRLYIIRFTASDYTFGNFEAFLYYTVKEFTDLLKLLTHLIVSSYIEYTSS